MFVTNCHSQDFTRELYCILLLTLSGSAFSDIRQAGEGGGGLTGSQAHSTHEMKLCMSHYNGNLSGFGDMTSQNFLLKKETSHQIRLFIPGK